MKKKVAKKNWFQRVKQINIVILSVLSLVIIVSVTLSIKLIDQRAQALTALPKCPIVFSHAGDESYAPMDSKPAITKAIEQGATGIEGNLRFSSNGQPIMFHDVTTWGLNKLTNDTYRDSNGYGHAVSKRTWIQLQALDLSQPAKFGNKYKGTKILTFYQWLILVKPKKAMVEFKVKPTAAQWVTIKSNIKSSGMEKNIIIYSTDAGIVDDIHANLPNMPYMQWGKNYTKPLVVWEQWQRAVDDRLYGVMTANVPGFRSWSVGKCTF